MVMWSLAGCASYYSAVRRYVVAECMRYSDPGGSDLGWRAGALDSGRERLESLAEGTRPYVPQECRQSWVQYCTPHHCAISTARTDFRVGTAGPR